MVKQQLTNYLSKISYEFKKHLDNKEVITNILSEVIITLGVVLIIGGVYLMLVDPGSSSQTSIAAKSIIDITAWIPGLPFFVNDLKSISITAIGLISWVMGLNLLLTGLGLWIRHGLARLAALVIFFMTIIVQFTQILLSGIVGAPNSVVLLLLDVVIVYLVFTKIDSQKINLKAVQTKFSRRRDIL